MRLVGLDQVGLERQRLGFTVGDDEFDLADLTHHQMDAGAQIMRIAEVTAHTAAQALRFTDVENAVIDVAHQVTTRFGGQLPEALAEAIGIGQQGLGDAAHGG